MNEVKGWTKGIPEPPEQSRVCLHLPRLPVLNSATRNNRETETRHSFLDKVREQVTPLFTQEEACTEFYCIVKFSKILAILIVSPPKNGTVTAL